MFWLTWLCGYVGKLFRCLIKNIRFCGLKHSLKKVLRLVKISSFVAQNTAGKQKSRQKCLVLMPLNVLTLISKYVVVSRLFKNPVLKMSRCLVKKYPVVSRLRMSTGQLKQLGECFSLLVSFAMNMVGKYISCRKYHILLPQTSQNVLFISSGFTPANVQTAPWTDR